MQLFFKLPESLLQCFSIFLSLIIEALPFILLGSILSGIIETFLTPDFIHKHLPKRKWLAILFGTLAGFFFPSCECGIIPIIKRLIDKQVPYYTAIPFMISAPIINPIVLFATYSAFGHSWKFLLLRLLGALLLAISMGISLAFILKTDLVQTKQVSSHLSHQHGNGMHDFGQKLFFSLNHAIDDFFEMGSYLIYGCLLAAIVQIYLPTSILNHLTKNPLIAILTLMIFAVLLSLCSEADAFIGASLLTYFSSTSVLAFLLFGPLVDLKNLILMHKYFRKRFIWQYLILSASIIILYCLCLEVFL